LKPREYEVLTMAVAFGVRHGWRDAHKWQRDPNEDTARATIEQAVLNAICEWFHIGDDEPES